jgi:hypothetical protein
VGRQHFERLLFPEADRLVQVLELEDPEVSDLGLHQHDVGPRVEVQVLLVQGLLRDLERAEEDVGQARLVGLGGSVLADREVDREDQLGLPSARQPERQGLRDAAVDEMIPVQLEGLEDPGQARGGVDRVGDRDRVHAGQPEVAGRAGGEGQGVAEERDLEVREAPRLEPALQEVVEVLPAIQARVPVSFHEELQQIEPEVLLPGELTRHLRQFLDGHPCGREASNHRADAGADDLIHDDPESLQRA